MVAAETRAERPHGRASSIALQTGSNVLAVTARDAAGNTSIDTLTVTFTPTPRNPVSHDHIADQQFNADGFCDTHFAGWQRFGQRGGHASELGQQPRRQRQRNRTTSWSASGIVLRWLERVNGDGTARCRGQHAAPIR